MDLRPGYKQTEVGVIPEDWEVSTIQYLLDQMAIVGHLDGNHGELYPRSHEFKDSGVPYVTANDLCGHQVSFNNCKYLSEERARRFRKGVAKSGDVLFAHNATVGPTSLLSTELDYVVLSTTATYFRCNAEKLLNSFLLYALQSASFVDQYRSVMAQSTRNQVPITAQRKLSLVLPASKAEQEAIADALGDADALIESLEQLLTKKRQLKQGAMQELLTGKKRLPGFSGEWKEKTFGEVFDYFPTATNSRSDLTDAGDAYYIHYGDIHTRFHSHLDFRADYPPRIERHRCQNAALLKNGDWIMADASEDLDGVGKFIEILGLKEGETAVAGLHTFLLRERIPTFAPGFKGHLGNLQSLHEQFLRVVTGMKVFGVSKLALRYLLFPVPSQNEQTAIATILSDMDADISTLEAKLTKARAIKQGMMQQLLTGNIRLVEPKPVSAEPGV